MKTNSTLIKDQLRKNLMAKYPFYFIPRQIIGEATNQIVKPNTVRNEASLGTGIANPVTIKGKICYGIDEIIDYIFKNSSEIITSPAETEVVS